MKNTIRLATYNIDGLPEKLDLNSLPWIFKPFVWVYRLITGTTEIRLNDNSRNTSLCTRYISSKILDSQLDIIGVQEDFNYHNDLINYLSNDYIFGKYLGGFDLSSIFSILRFFPFPRFKFDGLNLLSKKSRIKINEEIIVRWNKSNGYIKHANDLLISKGFRLYNITLDSKFILDIYNLHMDADFYDKEKCPDVSKDIKARESQLKQIINFIKNRGSLYPSIIMGDTNCSPSYYWDEDLIKNILIDGVNSLPGLIIEEINSKSDRNVDRVFYINSYLANYKLAPLKCFYDRSFNKEIGEVSDHFPFIAEFEIKN